MSNLYGRSCPSLYRGIIEDNKDPENLGRCKVRVPSIHGELTYPIDILPWARPIVSSPVSINKGSVNIPDIGDIVWVLFEGGIRDFPVYFGGTYAKGDIDVDLDIINIHMEDNSKLSYDRTRKEYSIMIGNNSIKVSSRGVIIGGNIEFTGNLQIIGDLSVAGTTYLDVVDQCNIGRSHD